jgi:hypothetical protein
VRILAAVVLFLVLAIPSEPLNFGGPQLNPDMKTVSGFLEMCAAQDKSPEDWTRTEILNDGYCIGWINGFVNGVLESEAIHYVPTRLWLVCPPPGNSFGQMIHIVKKYVADHPELEHFGTETLALRALSAAFPCKK